MSDPTEPFDEMGADMTADDGAGAIQEHGDIVTGAVARTREELAARRQAGEIPEVPKGELERHFAGVVEAVDAALVEVGPIGTEGLHESARLETWRARRGVRDRVLGLVLLPFVRLFGATIRRQVGPFSQRTAEILGEVVDRQNRMQRFLARAHLDRIRSLEYRIAELEREVGRLRDAGPER